MPPCEFADDFVRVVLSNLETAGVGNTKKGERLRFIKGRLVGSANKQVVTPDGWHYEGSLSHTFGFVPEGQVQKSLEILRHENGLDVYRNVLPGKEIFVGRSAGRVDQ